MGVQFDARDELKPDDLTDTGRRQFLHSLEELGLQVASLTFPLRRQLTDPDHLDARITAIKRAMEFARQLKASVLTIKAGRIPAEVESPDHVLMREILSDLARHGNHVGVTLAITPTHDAPQTLHDFVASIKTGLLGIDFDPAALVIGGHKPEAGLRELHESVVHFTARDGIRDVDGNGVEVPLGRGEVDWIELLALLTETGYRGWVTSIRTQGADQAGDVARGVQFLKQLAWQ